MTINELITTMNGDSISALGAISSIAGFILSVFVLLTVRKIKKFYIFTARVPQVNEKLSEIASSISIHLNNFDGFSTKTYEILANAEITLKSLGRKVDGPLKKEVNSLVNDIKSINKNSHPLLKLILDFVTFRNRQPSESDTEFLERIYVSLYKITNECREKYEDARWER